ncbi:hypothetical protein [Streptomyces sp. NBC_01089]|uniref:hypothetical protein n=1 Tax=Streptomyces sp. NBC_01089 TaxID=2903747 RepID=UPI0038678E4D|nr:hypothetical protein OG510_07390 [Streptomyces sp. NBC_01089]
MDTGGPQGGARGGGTALLGAAVPGGRSGRGVGARGDDQRGPQGPEFGQHRLHTVFTRREDTEFAADPPALPYGIGHGPLELPPLPRLPARQTDGGDLTGTAGTRQQNGRVGGRGRDEQRRGRLLPGPDEQRRSLRVPMSVLLGTRPG